MTKDQHEDALKRIIAGASEQVEAVCHEIERQIADAVMRFNDPDHSLKSLLDRPLNH